MVPENYKLNQVRVEKKRSFLNKGRGPGVLQGSIFLYVIVVCFIAPGIKNGIFGQNVPGIQEFLDFQGHQLIRGLPTREKIQA